MVIFLKVTQSRINFINYYLNDNNDTIEKKIMKVCNMDNFFIINDRTFLYNDVYKKIRLYNKKFNYYYNMAEFNLLLYDITFKNNIEDPETFLLEMYRFIHGLDGIYINIVFNLKYENILTFYLRDLNEVENYYYEILKNNTVENIKVYTNIEENYFTLIKNKDNYILKNIRVKNFDINTFTFEIINDE